jgi:SAM-dependent methyltransferase
MRNITVAEVPQGRCVPRLPLETKLGDLWYSVRRYYVDEFYLRHVPALPKNCRVLDVGGTKRLKRGQFDLERYDLPVCYANLFRDKFPDVQCDAAALPFLAHSFPAVICSEVIEFIRNPRAVLTEIHRVMETHGVLLLCIPFLFRIEGDPVDYGRYTDRWWQEQLATLGFTEITIEWQGFWASVLVDMLRDLAEHKKGWHSPWTRRMFNWGGRRLLNWARHQVPHWDAHIAARQDAFADWYCEYTTGFGIRAVKA